MKIVNALFLFCLWLIPAPLGVLGQTDFGYLEEKESIFFVDYATFREEPGEKYKLEIYYQILTKGLAFVKNKDKFKASYEIQVFVSNKINKQVTGTSTEEDYFADNYEETRSPSNFLINQITVSLFSGRYKLRIKLIDRNSGSAFELEKDLNIPSRIKKNALFSDIEFIRQLTDPEYSHLDSIRALRFDKGGKTVIPSVSRSYGDIEPILYFYYELYNGPPKPQPYLLRYQIEHQAQAFVHRETTTVIFGPETFSTFDSVSLGGFPSGDYSLAIELLENGQIKAKTERKFQIEWSFLNLLKNDYYKALDQLKYVASSEEMKKLKQVPEDQRLQSWLEFWKSKDPTPNTPENELRDEYYRRLRYVNQNFALPTREGWETDMGMIYMIYGHPDEVEKHPFEREEPAYQTWYYYKNGRVFKFVDRGDGEYELQPPYDGLIRRY
jgi:GWxTD domain-containing protein